MIKIYIVNKVTTEVMRERIAGAGSHVAGHFFLNLEPPGRFLSKPSRFLSAKEGPAL